MPVSTPVAAPLKAHLSKRTSLNAPVDAIPAGVTVLNTGTTPLAKPRHTVVVFGGNGTVGLGVLEALYSIGGFDVHAISRRGGPPAGLGRLPWAAVVTWHACDVRDQVALQECIRAVSPTCAVIAIGRLRAWDQLFRSRHAKVEDDAKTPALLALQASQQGGVERLVYVSGLFPESMSSPARPTTGPARWLEAWLAPQRRAKVEVEATLTRLFSKDNGLIIRAGLVCGRFEVAGYRIWLPPFTHRPGPFGWLRRVVPDAATAVEIGEACARFFRGEYPGGVIEGGAGLGR